MEVNKFVIYTAKVYFRRCIFLPASRQYIFLKHYSTTRLT